jgi:antitoxin component YwqK of YwqJK toxin-antitoxin module
MRFITTVILLAIVQTAALAENIVCQQGTVPNGEKTPDVREAWCELETDRSLLHGPYRSWYGDGVLGTAENYNHGKRDGQAEYHWGNGNPQASGQYRQGLRDGIWTFHELYGGPVIRVKYHNGKIVSGHEPKWAAQ